MAQLVERLSKDEMLALSPRELAAKLDSTLTELNRMFQCHFGRSVNALRLELRLVKALSLLSDPAAKIAGVAAQCGFKHTGLFKICFQKRFGVAPGECRRQNRLSRARKRKMVAV